MKRTDMGKILYLDAATAAAASEEPAVDAATTLAAVTEALIEGGYDPILQLSSYFVGNDPTFLPDDTEARTLAHPVGRDRLLEALLRHYLEHRDHE